MKWFSRLFKRKRYSKVDWVEDSFIFESNSGKQVALPQSNQFFGKSVGQKKITWFFVFVFFVLSLIWSRFFYIQLMRGEFYRGRADSNRERIVSIPAERGIVYDRNQVPLTQNIPSFSLAIALQDLPNTQSGLDAIATRLSTLTEKPKEELLTQLEEYRSNKSKYRSLVIQENLDYEAALLFQIDASDLPGVHIERGSKRFYFEDFDVTLPIVNPIASSTISLSAPTPTSTSATTASLSHLLGYLSKVNTAELTALEGKGYLLADTIGKNGIEKQYEENLRGTYGKRRLEVDTAGRQQVVLSEEAPTPGTHLVLSLDVKMQTMLEQIMRQNLEKFQKQKGVAIAMDPRNGEILAMVSLPTFNNNDFSGGIKSEQYKKYIEDENLPLFGRAISGTYPSGSTIKPAIAASALQEGLITAKTTLQSTGGIQVGPWFFPDWKAGGHGVTDVRKSLAESVNTFYYTIGGGNGNQEGLGVDRINTYLKKFGISNPLGIDIPGEGSGFLPTKQWKEDVKKERWYIGDTYNLSIGQGDLLVTPLQIASLTATIANGGTVYQPRFLHSWLDPKTLQRTPVQSTVLNSDFIKKGHLETVRWGMRDCVTDGSCRRLSTLPLVIAGKTGTAQWNSNKENHGWFTSFAPFDNPQIVLTVLIEEGVEGSTSAVPVAYDFYKWWATYKK